MLITATRLSLLRRLRRRPLFRRAAGWIGADGNPLRRPMDKFEAVLRLALVPVFVMFLVAGGTGSRIAAFFVFGIASVTDLLDGPLARPSGMITDSGNPQAYPIAGFTWVLAYVNQTNKAKGEALVNMLWWAIHDGQQYCTPLNYAPLSAAAVSKAEKEIESIQYQGQHLYQP